ncbi:hypothetical protein [Flavobacterium granuli]|uniref:Uncharacterized protein n=1 Tax=Flavobacterium granuli TaxID=280093 RepID=A0ABU1S0F0_9FLAO|nr:hypothetical protein [Flavobacterium granuli]MDR6844509.1 hypothetical protein [Flavobacterium granuli]
MSDSKKNNLEIRPLDIALTDYIDRKIYERKITENFVFNNLHFTDEKFKDEEIITIKESFEKGINSVLKFVSRDKYIIIVDQFNERIN